MLPNNPNIYYDALKVKDIAAMLDMSERWVYDHWRELGGVKIGGTLFFSIEGVNNTLQRKGQMESHTQIQRNKRPDKMVRNQEGGLGMGTSRKGSAEKDRIATAIRHGLVDPDGQVS